MRGFLRGRKGFGVGLAFVEKVVLSDTDAGVGGCAIVVVVVEADCWSGMGGYFLKKLRS